MCNLNARVRPVSYASDSTRKLYRLFIFELKRLSISLEFNRYIQTI